MHNTQKPNLSIENLNIEQMKKILKQSKLIQNINTIKKQTERLKRKQEPLRQKQEILQNNLNKLEVKINDKIKKKEKWEMELAKLTEDQISFNEKVDYQDVKEYEDSKKPYIDLSSIKQENTEGTMREEKSTYLQDLKQRKVPLLNFAASRQISKNMAQFENKSVNGYAKLNQECPNVQVKINELNPKQNLVENDIVKTSQILNLPSIFGEEIYSRTKLLSQNSIQKTNKMNHHSSNINFDKASTQVNR